MNKQINERLEDMRQQNARSRGETFERLKKFDDRMDQLQETTNELGNNKWSIEDANWALDARF